MSRDFQQLIHNPQSMVWSEEKPDDKELLYRLLDAPLTRYLVGMGLWASGMQALPVDWDWTKSWDENRLSGALPQEALLLRARTFTTSLIPLAMFFIFLTGIAFGGHLTGYASGILLGLNALVLLHGRRVMAESALLMSVSLCLWAMMVGEKKPWLAGISAALAFNSKQSTVALLPVSILSVVWLVEKADHPLKKRLLHLFIFTCTFALLVGLFNPFAWKEPANAIRTAWQTREALVARQVSEALPAGVTTSQQAFSRRSLVMMANLYITDSAFAEVGNYRAETDESERAYRGVLPHHLGRGLIAGGILFALTISGVIFGFLQLRSADAAWRKKFWLLFLAMFSQAAVLIIGVPLPWQRYVIPLVPYACLWPAFSVQHLLRVMGARK